MISKKPVYVEYHLEFKATQFAFKFIALVLESLGKAICDIPGISKVSINGKIISKK